MGWPVNATCDENFKTVFQRLEKKAEIYTFGEIHQKMVDLAGSKENAYSIKWMKKKLKDRYKEHLSFLAADGKMTKIYFKDMIDYLLNEKQWHAENNQQQSWSSRISDLRNMTPNIIYAEKVCQK